MSTDFAFSNWQAWAFRDQLPNLRHPGIYAIAGNPELIGRPFQWSPEIVYFGMTNSLSGLRGRLNQFDKSLVGKTGHGGGQRLMYGLPTDGSQRQRLCVAVWSFECDIQSSQPSDLLVRGEVARAEYLCFARFVELFGRLPTYNNKQSPKMKIEIGLKRAVADAERDEAPPLTA